MSGKKQISSLSISGRITLDMHSLNNEGGEGNQILTRQVTIINKEGEPVTVNAVSGDMLKHIQAEHLYNIAIETGLKLCNSCKVFNANRITGDEEFKSWLKQLPVILFEEEDKKKYAELNQELEKNKGNKEKEKTIKKKIKKIEEKYPPSQHILHEVIKRCTIDDIEGILITNEGNNVPRKSVVEFGWLIALPEASKTENFFHVKLVPDAGKETGKGEEGANVGQNIFHRPANSGVYALVSNFDLCRIGYNDISKVYAIDDTERQQRYQALLKSILYTFLKPTGAMRNTQNPHIVNFEGVISYSSSSIPAPTVSALNDNYDKEIKGIAENLNKIVEGSIDVEEFSSLKEFTEKFQMIINNTEPVKLAENKKEK